MGFYLGGQRITGIGMLGPQSVYVDFVADYTSGYLYQLYANRLLIGTTQNPTGRRVIGQLMANVSPAPLSFIRVDAADWNTDFGPFLNRQPWNRFLLEWSVTSQANLDHFDLVMGDASGGAIDLTNVLAKVPAQTPPANYSFQLDPLPAGTWNFGIVPRGTTTPNGIEGTPMTVSIPVVLPPKDVTPQSNGKRFTFSSTTGGNVTIGFNY